MAAVGLTHGRPVIVDDRDAIGSPGRDRIELRITHVLVDEADRRDRGRDRWLGSGAVGVVTITGDGVDPDLVGVEVLVAGPAPCRSCPTCRRGQPHLCLEPTRDDAATRGIGGARDRLVVDPARTIAVPSGLSSKAATLVGGPALTGAAAVRGAARLVPGERIALVGDTAALVATGVARAAGARAIVTCPVVEDDVAAALDLGATAAGHVDELAALVDRTTDGLGVDACVLLGAPIALVDSVATVTRPGGIVVLADLDRSPAGGGDGDGPTRVVVSRGRTVLDAPAGGADPLRDLPWLLGMALDGTIRFDGLVETGADGLAGVVASATATNGPPRTVHRLD